MKPSPTSLLLSTVLLAAGLMAGTPSPAAAQACPNEPTGGTLLTDWGFNSQSWPSGWGGGPPQIVSDPSAPQSPSSVARQTFSTGMGGGVSPSNYYYTSIPYPTRELYTCYWWKASNPWQGHVSGTNKIHFFMGGGSTWNQVVDMHGPVNGPYKYYLYFPINGVSVSNGHISSSYGDDPGSRVLVPNVTNPDATLGQWHRIEHYAKLSSSATSRDGILMWWVDGQLVGNFTNVNYPQEPIVEFQFSPTWGGTGDVKAQTDYFQWDHVRLVTGGSVGGGTKSDTTPPSVPSGLRAN